MSKDCQVLMKSKKGNRHVQKKTKCNFLKFDPLHNTVAIILYKAMEYKVVTLKMKWISCNLVHYLRYFTNLFILYQSE